MVSVTDWYVAGVINGVDAAPSVKVGTPGLTSWTVAFAEVAPGLIVTVAGTVPAAVNELLIATLAANPCGFICALAIH